jgi:hypothetical protein
MPHETVLADGSFDFSGGVDSDSVTTVQSELVPSGLPRNKLAWLSNATVRNGAIRQRTGWFKLCDLLTSGLYQGGFLYEPIDETSPYLMVLVSGQLYRVLLDPPFTITNLSGLYGQTMPATIPMAFFCQAEAFLIIQSGDYYVNPTPTLPLFYNPVVQSIPEALVRSRGIIGAGNMNNQLPAGTAMSYFAQRVWYAQGRVVTAGDIVKNQSSGTAPWQFRDSVLAVTENPLATGGDGFSVPSQAGNVRGLAYTANLDTLLGQGQLYLFTRKQVYALNPPVTRANWIAADTNNQPLITVAQITNGAVGDRCLTHVNGDLFYQGFDPGIRSLFVASRSFTEWGNLTISTEETAALASTDRSIQRFASGIQFDNRVLQSIQPVNTPRGVAFNAIAPLNFDTVSTLGAKKPPAWEGDFDGVQFMQLFTGDFGGRPRAVGVVVAAQDSSLDIWEISDSAKFENGDNRVHWSADFPAYTWGKEYELKQLMGGEVWIDKVFGTVQLTAYYRPDADNCWHLWHTTSFCTARNCAEDESDPVCYPVGPNYREVYRFPVVLPRPPLPGCNAGSRRPWDIGYQFQTRIEIIGWCRIRGLILYAAIREKQLYDGLGCSV